MSVTLNCEFNLQLIQTANYGKYGVNGNGYAGRKVQRVLTTKIFPRQAKVITVSDWSKTLK